MGKVAGAEASSEDAVRVSFADGSEYEFHAIWLRDACRDETFVKNAAGEKRLELTLLNGGIDALEAVKVSKASVAEEGESLEVSFKSGEIANFTSKLLTAYAPV